MKTKQRRWSIVIILAVLASVSMVGFLALRARSNAVDLVAASEAGDRAEVLRLLSTGVPASASYHGIAGFGAGEPHITRKAPLLAAARRGHSGVVEVLLQHAADIEGANEQAETALIIACRENRYEAARTLIQHGADVNARCERGRTPLLWAAGYASPRVVALLLDNRARGGADIAGLSALDLVGRRAEPDRQKILDLLAKAQRK